jgi:TatD DNase family protein
VATLIDTHCHLDFIDFDSDRDEVLKRAWDAGVVRILVPGIDLSTSRNAVSLAQKNENVFAATGVHPNEALSWEGETIKALRELASESKVMAIGEIGLDYYRERTSQDLQRRIFLAQLDLAAELEMPVVIHNRNASEDLISIISDWKNGLEKSKSSLMQRLGVLHSFSGNLEIAMRAIELGLYLGFTGPITFKNAEDLRQIAATVPLDKVLIETDSPFLAPQPRRGSRNEPAYVRYIAEKLAEIHQLPFEDVTAKVKSNADTLFRW